MSMPARRRSLRGKLIAIVLVASCAALLLSAAALLAYEVYGYRRVVVADLASQGDLLAQSLAPTLSFDDPKAAEQALAALKLRPHVRQAVVFASDGRPFASYRDEAGADAGAPERRLCEQDGFGLRRVVLCRDIRRDDESVGTILLVAEHELAGRLVGYLLIVAFASAAGLGSALLIYRRMHPAITRPILAVADAARRVMDSQDYALRVHETSDDEVGDLVAAFNGMLDRLALEMRERHAAEAALREADRRKDEFLATLAHELRNPLAPMRNALEILRLADADPGTRQRAREMMQRQLAQMVRLIDDLLDVSRITHDRLELRRETADVVVIAGQALEAAEPLLRARRHGVHASLPPQPVWVDADVPRLTQVLVNLLSNAAKYTPEQGRIELQVLAREDEVEIAVIDDGIGLAPEQREVIFGMFVQAGRSPGRVADGLGVGLTIARRLVQMHGGRLRAESAGPGQGSSFVIVLPRVAPPVA